MTVALCRGITHRGERCRARPRTDSAWCLNHDPAISDEQRRVWKARGGHNSASKVRARKSLPAEVMSVEEIEAYLALVFRHVIVGRIDPSVGTAASNIARTMAELKKAAMDERLGEIERVLGIATRRAS